MLRIISLGLLQYGCLPPLYLADSEYHKQFVVASDFVLSRWLEISELFYVPSSSTSIGIVLFVSI